MKSGTALWVGVLAVASAAALATVPAGATPQALTAATRTVTLRDIAFKPARLSVARGTEVRFVWRDGATDHDVKSVGRPRFAGATRRDEEGRTHRITFRSKGTYRYECTLHPGMTGRISVR